ncbi:MAG: aminotransferase class I/II-fold pyridoxal phosphate-dependent enzyme, partial [Candidatus Omnitrophica bacterium]|nr:aminotransferase class I/II-fold pyridoxal phosphate-dependent enzyme [Candidatus Omnitrophota bacterium]
TGSSRAHYELEKKIAKFKNKPASIVFNSGYQANIGIISALLKKGDCVFSDRLNHASIVDGIRLSGAKHFRFRHNDMAHLKALLEKERDRFNNALIVTETIFSMDGDIAPVEDIVKLKKKYDCEFMVDEAHATGIFGKNGSGIIESKKIADDIDVIMGTFSKAFGSFGSYAAVSAELREYLINTSRSFIYSTALPISVIEANIAAIDVVKNESYRRKELLSNAKYMRGLLKKEGLPVIGESQIIPLMVKDDAKALRLSDSLKDKGFWVVPVRPPTVPKGQSRLRISLTYDHNKQVINKFVSELVKLEHING